jgi:predicted 3-demethylubiquinone-9 3-methyltransferase (glyoxalase superfamily)
MKGVIPFLWFDTQAEEAANHYVSIFPNARLGEIRRFPAGDSHGAAGSVMTASFELAGQTLVALNGNKRHAFSPASSLLYFCRDAAEVAAVTDKLSAGGERQPGGWLRDKYGVSWQVMAASHFSDSA